MLIPEIDIPNYLSEAIDQDREPSPLAVLDRFANSLPDQTGGFVEAQVNVAPFLGNTRYTFYLLVPQVNDYTDPLFYVWNTESGRDYPVAVLPAGADQEDAVPCRDAASLTNHVNELFQQAWVKTRIRQWIELARERTPQDAR